MRDLFAVANHLVYFVCMCIRNVVAMSSHHLIGGVENDGADFGGPYSDHLMAKIALEGRRIIDKM